MKALILNSGTGSRMGVLTSEHPKCMTEVSPNETILSRQLNQLVDFGVKEVVLYHKSTHWDNGRLARCVFFTQLHL